MARNTHLEHVLGVRLAPQHPISNRKQQRAITREEFKPALSTISVGLGSRTVPVLAQFVPLARRVAFSIKTGMRSVL